MAELRLLPGASFDPGPPPRGAEDLRGRRNHLAAEQNMIKLRHKEVLL